MCDHVSGTYDQLKEPCLLYGWVISMCGYKQKWIVAALQLSSGSELKENSENLPPAKCASGTPVTLLVEAEVALVETIYRFLCSG